MSVPSGFGQMATIIKYEMLKFLRGKKLYIILAIIAIIMAALIGVPKAFGKPYPDSLEMMQFFTRFVSIVIILLVTLFGADSVVYDFEKGTGFLLYPNPIRRKTIFVGKFLAALIVSIAVLSLYYILASTVDFGINGGIPPNTLYSLLLAIAYLTALMGVTFLISTVMKSTLASSVIVFALFFLILPMPAGILTIVGQKPWYILTSMSSVIEDILITPFPKTIVQETEQFTLLFYHPTPQKAIAVMAGYFVPAMLLAYRQFTRKELL
ncbi:MAG: ABC transporter permease [Candidatus Methanofastidiosia archaeon]